MSAKVRRIARLLGEPGILENSNAEEIRTRLSDLIGEECTLSHVRRALEFGRDYPDIVGGLVLFSVKGRDPRYIWMPDNDTKVSELTISLIRAGERSWLQGQATTLRRMWHQNRIMIRHAPDKATENAYRARSIALKAQYDILMNQLDLDADWPPKNWLPHPKSTNYYYNVKTKKVMTEVDLRKKIKLAEQRRARMNESI